MATEIRSDETADGRERWTLDYEAYPRVAADGRARPDVLGKTATRRFGSGRNCNSERYFSPEVHGRERNRLWRKNWLLAGHLNDIPRPNNFLKFDVGPDTMLIVRSGETTVRAMHNVCQHRGTVLVTQDYGSAKIFACPYHGWQFRNDGSLHKVTRPETFPEELLCENLDLPEVRVEVWRGWIFVNQDLDAKPLADHIPEDFKKALAAYDLQGLVRVRDIAQEWPVNWKTAMEAFWEGYHVEVLHSQMNTVLNTHEVQFDLYDNGFSRQVYRTFEPQQGFASYESAGLPEELVGLLGGSGHDLQALARDPARLRREVAASRRRKLGKAGLDLDAMLDEQIIDTWNFGLFPATAWSVHPEGILVNRWWPHPHDPRKCKFHYQVYAMPGVEDLPPYFGVPPGTDTSGKTVLRRTYAEPDDLEIIGQLLAQDAKLLPRLQAGIEASGYRGAVYSDQEIKIRQFYELYDRIINE